MRTIIAPTKLETFTGRVRIAAGPPFDVVLEARP
jgi:hypothetical protein